MKNTIKTILHAYYFDLTQENEAAQYEEMRATLRDKGFPPFKFDLRDGYTAKSKEWDFARKIDELDANRTGVEIELETEFLFADQWNVAPMPGFDTGARLFNWAAYKYKNKYIKSGYWLEQTDEMREVLRNTYKCGYCGKQEPAAKGYVFCPHCLGSEYLKESDLHLTRMRSIDSNGERAPLTEAERAYLLPLYIEAQTNGLNERDKARIAKARKSIQEKYQKAVNNATREYEGFTWLMDNGIKTDNVIYYAHTGEFSFGWRSPVDTVLLDLILSKMSEFPFDYEIKCADGRTLSSAFGDRRDEN